jgi:hypothetical protein
MEKMFKPQAISFDIQKSIPFAVSVPGRSWEQIGKFELLQWTGFSDENGIDVYEEDFVKISSVIYKVIWNEKQAAFELIELESSSKCEINLVASGSIIGNQFEFANLCPIGQSSEGF